MSQFKLIIILFIILLIIFFIYVNIWIPRFCYHKKLSSSGNCRICLHEFKGFYKPLLAFTMNFLIFSYKKKVLLFSFFFHSSKKFTHQKRYYNSNSLKNTDKFVFTSSCYPLRNKCLTVAELNALSLSDSDQIFNFIEERICKSFIKTLIKDYTDEKLFDTEPLHYRETNHKGLHFLFYNDKKKTDYFYIFYKKKIIYFIDDLEYIIYCVYYLHQNSFDGPNEIMYSCDYIYQNENGSFSYNEKVSDNISIFMNKEEEKKDLFFIKALLDKIFFLVQFGIEVIDIDLFGTVEINKAPFFFGKYSLSNMNSGSHKLFESVIKLNKNTTEIKKLFNNKIISLVCNSIYTKKNTLFNNIIIKSVRNYSTNINSVFQNYIINIVSFEFDSHIIRDTTKFNSLSEEEKRVYLFDCFFSIFIKSTNAYNAKCFTVDNIYYVNDVFFIKFYEVLDFKLHDLIIYDNIISFYSLCIFTNNSIKQISDSEYEITLFFSTFNILDNLMSEDIMFDINEHRVVSKHLDKYLYENKNMFMEKIKNRIIYFKKNSIFNAIMS